MRKTPRWFWPALLALGLGAVAWRAAVPHLGFVSVSDAVVYHAIATNISDGRGFSLTRATVDGDGPVPTAWRPPLYPLVLALLPGTPRTFEDATRQATGFNVWCAGVAVVCLGWLGLMVHGRALAALIGAALLIFDPVQNDLARQAATEPLFIALLLAAAAAMVYAADRGRWRWAAAGALFGLAILTRPVLYLSLLGLVLLLIGHAWKARPAREPLRQAAIFTLAIALVVGPWLVRNAALNGRVTGVTTNSGFNFYRDNSERPGGDVWEEYDALNYEVPARRSEADLDAWYMRRGAATVAADPGRFLNAFLDRLRQMASEPGRLSLFGWLGLGLAWWRRPRENELVVVMLAGIAATYALTFYELRLASVLMPFRYLYAAAFPFIALAWWRERQPAERRKTT